MAASVSMLHWHCAEVHRFHLFMLFHRSLIECPAATMNEKAERPATINNRRWPFVRAICSTHCAANVHRCVQWASRLQFAKRAPAGQMTYRPRSVFQKLRKRERKWITVALLKRETKIKEREKMKNWHTTGKIEIQKFTLPVSEAFSNGYCW